MTEDYKIITRPKIIHTEETLIEIPHGDRILSFSPWSHLGTEFDVQSRIRDRGNRPATFAETVSLLYTVMKNPQEEVFKEIHEALNKDRDYWVWAFTGLYHTPEGVFIEDNPKISYGGKGWTGDFARIEMNKDKLIKRLETKDPLVRYVPRGYKEGEQSISEIAKNSLIMGLAGEEGAEKLAKLCAEYKENPVIYDGKITTMDKDKRIRESRNVLSFTTPEDEYFKDPSKLFITGYRYDSRWGKAMGVRQ